MELIFLGDVRLTSKMASDSLEFPTASFILTCFFSQVDVFQPRSTAVDSRTRVERTGTTAGSVSELTRDVISDHVQVLL